MNVTPPPCVNLQIAFGLVVDLRTAYRFFYKKHTHASLSFSFSLRRLKTFSACTGTVHFHFYRNNPCYSHVNNKCQSQVSARIGSVSLYTVCHVYRVSCWKLQPCNANFKVCLRLQVTGFGILHIPQCGGRPLAITAVIMILLKTVEFNSTFLFLNVLKYMFYYK